MSVFEDVSQALNSLVKSISEVYRGNEQYRMIEAIFCGLLTAQPILFIGAHGTMKCVDYNTPILIAKKEGETLRWRMTSVGKVVEETKEHEEVYVLSLNPRSLKIEVKRVLAFVKEPAPKSLIQITTKSGRMIVATDNHAFLTLKDGELQVVNGRDLKPGDVVPAIKHLPDLNVSSEEINSCLARLLGVYLAEGCYEDKKAGSRFQHPLLSHYYDSAKS